MSTTSYRKQRSRLALRTVVTALLFGANMAMAEPAQLHIVTEPRGATITIDGQVRGTAPLTLSPISPGKHLMVIEKHNYEPVRQTLELGDGETAAREIHLNPILGLILIRSTPSGADVEIDGAHRGTTPTFVSDLPLGRYRAQLTKPGFIPREIEINTDSRRPKKFDIQLTSDSATLEIASDPPGADVTLNGVARGTSPCSVARIPSGTVTLELTMKGFEPYTETLKLSAGENQAITAVMKAIPSDLKLVSIPTGARIYVNNQFRGTTPVELKAISPGTYRIRAEMPAHDILSRDVTVGRAQNTVEEFRLTPNAGALEVTTEPADVKVLLDGKPIGTTLAGTNATDRISLPLSAKLIPCGTHVLSLTKPGYYQLKAEIDISRDMTFTKHYRLKRRFIPNYEVKTNDEVYRGILVEVDAQRNIKLETHPGIFKTLKREEIRSVKPLREDQLKEDL
jgi:hypothetical protein